MKKIIILVLFVVPTLLVAQTQNAFLENSRKEISKLEVNTANSDFGPAFVEDELWSSAFSTQDIEKLEAGKNKGVFYNSYVWPVNGRGEIVGERSIAIEDISKGFHCGPVAYCEATKELFVTLSNYDNPDKSNSDKKVYRKSEVRLKIVVLKKVDGKWTLVEEMPFNNPSYSVGHPAISESGDTLYFASNNPETSLGMTDLYMSIRDNGTWGEPQNLGKNINSAKNEMFPSLCKSATLVFSSNRNEGQGLDLYYSKEGATLQAISELNSTEDDFGLVIHKKGKLGYFTSNRSGADDIFKVELK